MRAAPRRRLSTILLPALALLALATAAALLWLPPADFVQAQDGTQPPQVTAGPVISSSPASGDTYGKDETVRAAVTFSEAVTVTVNQDTGGPRVQLDVGERKRWARYERSEQDGALLVFAYTIRSNDADPDGVSIRQNGLKLAGGSIADADGNAADLSAPALDAQAGHKVDGSPPQVTAGPVITSSPQSGDTYGEGEAIAVTLTFSEAVSVTGQPRVRLDVGDRTRWARYSSGDGATTLSFAYTVKGNDRDEDGVSIGANQLQLRGGSIEDGGGNAASLEHPALPDQSGHKVNGSPEEPAEPEPTPTPTPTPTPAPTPTPEPEPANSAPQFASENMALSVNEDAATGANVGSAITATDADNDALTYALTGSDAFAINSGAGQVTVKSALDYETTASHSLTVSVTDGKNAAGEADTSVDDTIAVTVSVVNVDEAGTVLLDSQTPQAGSPVSAALSDPDGSVSGLAWSWAGSANGTDWTPIAGANARTYTPSADDVGRYLQATASYSDGQGPGKSAGAATTGAVAAANSAPQFSAENVALSVNEDAAVGANVGSAITATDADGDALTYALSGSDAFAINSGAGQITVKAALDYETQNSYSLTVSVTDGKDAAGGTDPTIDDTVAVTVSVGNVDEAGVVSLEADPDPPQTGGALTARLMDPDGGVSGLSWSWERSADGTTGWETIAGATGATYTLAGEDGSHYLRATASYTDAHGPGKTAQGALADPVTVPVQLPQTEAQAQTQTSGGPGGPVSVAPGWAHIPKSNNVPIFANGGSFRLLYVTKIAHQAGESSISRYDGSVRFPREFSASDPVSDPLYDIRNSIQAVISTSAVDARDHTGTAPANGSSYVSGEGVPIYWVGGDKVADDYADFWDGSWDSTSPRLATGGTSSERFDVWTGSNDDGTKHASQHAGTTGNVVTGEVGHLKRNDPITYSSAARGEYNELYGLTQVITVDAARPVKPAGFAAQPILADTVLLKWNNPNDSTIAKYQIRRKPKSSSETGYSDWTDIAGSGTGTTSHIVSGLREVEYTFQLRAVDGLGTGAASDEVRVTPRTAVNCAAVTATGQECTVPADWPLIPEGISGGDSFRLMFVTSTSTPATSKAIATYNAFVQNHAEKNRFLKSFASTFRALGSAWDVVARPNTFTRAGDLGENDPIYWVNGHRVTDTYANLYDKSWDYNVDPSHYPRTETGGTITSQWLIWTGTEWNGNPATTTQLGDTRVVAGKLNLGQHELRSPPDGSGVTDWPAAESRPLYALSPLLTVSGPPDQTYWTATLTVDAFANAYFGCNNQQTHQDNCSTTSVLTDDSFDYAGATYTVDWLYWRTGGALRLSFDGVEGRAAKTALGALTLNVDGAALAIKDATGDSDEVWWSHTPSSAWADGTTVALTLTGPGKAVKPSGFTASPGNTEVTLRWTDPSDSTITQYQYQQKAGTGAYGAWMDISGSSPTTTSHTVTGLMNWTAYTFRIRAVNAGGTSDPSDEATATPMTPVECETATATGQECTVPADWPLIPSGVSPGDSFRLMFVTSSGTQATSQNIATYNTHVQNSAEKNLFLKPFKSTFRALGSAWDTHARPNTFTRASDKGASAPIYWVNGTKVADNYADLYDKSWDYNAHSGQYPKTEAGASIVHEWPIWTGTEWTGGPASTTQLGDNRVVFGKLNVLSHELRSPPENPGATDAANSASYSMYALSPLLTVEEGPHTFWSATLTADEYEGEYFGCDSGDPFLANCSDVSVLTDDDFDYNGATYTVDFFYLFDDSLTLEFERHTGTAAKTALSALTLHVDGTALAFEDASADEDELEWDYTPSPVWDDGTTVSLSVTGPAPAADNTPPTVTVASTGYFGEEAAATRLTGTLKAGGDIYTKVTFSENMKHVKSDGASARPQLFYRIGSDDAQYDIVDNGDTLASGDCKPNHAIATNVYVCRYTAAAPANGAFTVKAGTASVDKADNALASVYTHAATLTLDTTQPLTTTQPHTVKTTIWSATLTADKSGSYFGCDNTEATQENCSAADVLTDDDFDHNGATYTVAWLHWASGGNRLSLSFESLTGAAAKTALGGLTLNVGGTALDIEDATASGNELEWAFDPDPDWTDGQTVAVTLAASPIWSATLTVDAGTTGTTLGCSNDYSDIDNCSTALTEDEIRLGSSTYEVTGLLYDARSQGTLELQIKDLLGTEVHNAFGSLALYVNGVGYRVSDSETTILAIRWPFDPVTDWAEGETVMLALAAREDPAAVNHVVVEPVCETPTLTGARCWVPHDSPLIPSAADLSPGQNFRLMFASSDGKAASDTTVGPYNAHVQAAANDNAELRLLKAYFRAMVQPSTMADYMKPNTRTRSGDLGAGDPIYWVKGPKVADNYADLYDGSWDYTSVSGDNPTDEDGTAITGAWKVWTGSKPDGTPQTGYRLGNDNVMYGLIQTSGRELGVASAVTSGDNKNVAAKATEQALYGISPVLTVGFNPKAPARPTGLKAKGLDQGVRLTWDEPLEDGVSDDMRVYKRQVQYRSRSGGSWGDWSQWADMMIMSSNNPPRKIYYIGGYGMNGLTNGTEYQFRIRALTEAGVKSAVSEPASATPKGDLAAPTGLVANSANSSVILHWDHPDNDDITRYQYRMRLKNTSSWDAWTVIPDSDSDTTAYTVRVRQNDQALEFEVRAGTGSGATGDPYVWGAISATVSATPEAPAAPAAAVSVAHNWALLPQASGDMPAIEPGQRFRLLFVTSGTRAATSTRISDYNAFVQEQARKNSLLSPFADGFRAVISTAGVNAYDNTAAVNAAEQTPEGTVPVYTYWVDGDLALNPFLGGDLYDDEDWISGSKARDESGKLSDADQVWTGSFRNGQTWEFYEYRFYAGAKNVRVGNPSDSRSHLHRDDDKGTPLNTTLLPLYGISPVITAQAPPSQ